MLISGCVTVRPVSLEPRVPVDGSGAVLSVPQCSALEQGGAPLCRNAGSGTCVNCFDGTDVAFVQVNAVASSSGSVCGGEFGNHDMRRLAVLPYALNL